MRSVYILEGWFGDIEWIEGVYASEYDAKIRCAELWETRTSEKGPDFATKLHKFAVEEYELL